MDAGASRLASTATLSGGVPLATSAGRVGQWAEATQNDKLDAVAALLTAVGSYVGVKHLYDEGRLLGCGTPVRSLFSSLEVFGAALVVDSRFVQRPAPWNPNFRVVELANTGPVSGSRVQADTAAEQQYELVLREYLKQFRSATVGSLGLAHPPPAELRTTCAAFVQARVDAGVFAVTRFTHSRRGASPQDVIRLSHAAPRKAAQAGAKPEDVAARGSTSPSALQSPGLAAMRRMEAEECGAAQPLTPLGSGMRRQRSDLDRLPITLDDDDDGFGDALIDVGHFIGTPAALKAQQQQQRAGSGGAVPGEPSAGTGVERRGVSSKPVCRYGAVCRNFPACPFQHPADMQAVVPQDRARPAPRGVQSGRTPRRAQPPRSPLLVVYNSTSPYRTPEKKGGEVACSSRGAGESPGAVVQSPKADNGTAASEPGAQQQGGVRRAPRKYAPPLH